MRRRPVPLASGGVDLSMALPGSLFSASRSGIQYFLDFMSRGSFSGRRPAA